MLVQSKEVKKPVHCSYCNYTTTYHSNYLRHCRTKAHRNKVEGKPNTYIGECKTCNLTFRSESNYKNHLVSKRHLRGGKKIAECPAKYQCIQCNIHTNRKNEWLRHIKTKKHKKRTSNIEKEKN